jgi:hypothetical protein
MYQSAYKPMTSDPASRASDAQSAYDTSRNRYDEEANRSYTERNEATTRAATARNTADKATEAYNKRSGGALSSWKPETYAPVSQVSQWMAALPRAGGGAARPMSGTRTPASVAPSGGGGAGGGGSAALSAYDTAALDAFDPTEAGMTFARGAQGDFKRGLDRELTDLRDTSVARGRFDTGLYDVDQGDIVTGLGEQFNDAIAQQSGVFSGQRLSALSDSARFRLERASGMDTNTRLYAEMDAEMREQASSRAAEQAMAADRLDFDYYSRDTDAGLSRDKMGLDASQFADDLDYRRTSDRDRLTFDQARGVSDIEERRATTGLESALGRERTYLDESRFSRGEATSAASSSREWAARDRELEELRAEIAALRDQRNGVGPGGARYANTPSMTAAEKAEAANRRSFGIA